MKKNEKINIVLDGEKTKEELIYNNIIQNLHLSSADEVSYLKGKVCHLERELKTRMLYTLLFLFAFVSLCFGIILLTFDLYILGIILIFSTFAFVVIRLLLYFKNTLQKVEQNEFTEVDELKKLLEEKLK